MLLYYVLISVVRIVCGEVNMPNIGLAILLLQLGYLKDLEMVRLTVHFKICFIHVWIIEFLVSNTYGIKVGNLEMTDLVSLIDTSEISRNINIDSSLNGIFWIQNWTWQYWCFIQWNYTDIKICNFNKLFS